MLSQKIRTNFSPIMADGAEGFLHDPHRALSHAATDPVYWYWPVLAGPGTLFPQHRSAAKNAEPICPAFFVAVDLITSVLLHWY